MHRIFIAAVFVFVGCQLLLRPLTDVETWIGDKISTGADCFPSGNDRQICETMARERSEAKEDEYNAQLAAEARRRACVPIFRGMSWTCAADWNEAQDKAKAEVARWLDTPTGQEAYWRAVTDRFIYSPRGQEIVRMARVLQARQKALDAAAVQKEE